MQVSDDLKNFLKDPELQGLINNGKFDEIYNKLNSFKSEPGKLIGEFTSLLLQADINPLNYMNRVPFSYLRANREISTVIIPYGIKSIGMDAFNGCTALTKIVIPNSVESIGSNAFDGCIALIDITIPNSVYTIYDEAFYECGSLINVHIPSSVKNIGEFAFDGCGSLEAVYITDVAAWCDIRFGSRYSNPLTAAHNLYLNGKLVTDLIIPDNVISIGDYAFNNCKYFKSITIGSGVKNIGYEAFDDCGENAIQINYNGSTSNFKKIDRGAYTKILDNKTIHCVNGDLKYNRSAQKWERI